MKISAAQLSKGFGILVAASLVVWIGYGLSLPEDFETVVTTTVTNSEVPMGLESLVIRPEAWPSYFSFIQKAERVIRPPGEPPHYQIKENFFVGYMIRRDIGSESRSLAWEVVGNSPAEGSFIEIQITNKGSAYEVRIKEKVKIKSPFFRTYYQIFRGYQTHREFFEKAFKN